MTRRTIDDIINAGQSLDDLTEEQENAIADLFEFNDYEPTPADFALSALRVAVHHRAAAEQEALVAVKCARQASLPWTAVGEVLGTSGEAARQRYRDLVA